MPRSFLFVIKSIKYIKYFFQLPFFFVKKYNAVFLYLFFQFVEDKKYPEVN